MDRHLHIVCLDVPWPADYGGAIDMMNRIRCFKEAGIQIHLHYFSYNDRGTPNELNQFCESIQVYERKTGHKGFSFRLPYIVSSRINQQLVANLDKDNHPILLEGLHCTGIVPLLSKTDRKIVVRMHNDERHYYGELARAEKSILKKIYFHAERKLIQKYYPTLAASSTYACISEADAEVLRTVFHLPSVVFTPAFTAWQKVAGEEGIGTYTLYHGNLSVPENEEVALWLINDVFPAIKKPLVIAGKNPSARLEKAAYKHRHICLVANPTETEMNDLVKKAHINILPCFNKNITGIRLKLLHALCEGRHCIAHEAMVKGTGLDGACHIGTSAASFASIVMQLIHQPFTTEEISLRKKLIGGSYNNQENLQRLIPYLW